jgi:tripartite-type tricarboxylate transporter receptor subunit TctC
MSRSSLRLATLIISMMTIASLVLTACGATPTPTAVPPTAVPPTAVPPTVAPTKAPAAPTTAPAAPTAAPVAPTAVPPTAVPTVAPTKAPTWPTKNITFVVPYSPGGGFDLQARIVAPLLEKALPLKATVVVANQSGASGKLGSTNVVKAAPDGYTIGIVAATVLAQMQVAGELSGIDITKLNWIGQASWDPGALVVNTASGIKTWQDLAKKEYRVGVTTDSLFQNLLLSRKISSKVRTVTFEGSADQVLAAMRGDVEYMMDSWSSMKKAVDASEGKLTALFVVADARLAQWPNVPTAKELGLDLKDMYAVAGTARLLVAPVGLPADVQAALEASVWKALNDPDFKANMDKAGYDGSRVANAKDTAATVALTLAVFQANIDILPK